MLEEMLCVHWKAAREQREYEIEAGIGTKGTEGYEMMGCYDCNVYKVSCPAYYSRALKCNLVVK